MEIVNAHYKRKCHPETCCCPINRVLVDENGFIVKNIPDKSKMCEITEKEQAQQWIKDLEEIKKALDKKVWEYNMSSFTASASELKESCLKPLQSLIDRMKRHQK